MGLNELMVRIGGDSQGLENILQRLARPFRNLQNTTRSMSSNMTNSFSNMVTRTSSNILRLDSTFRSRLSSIRGQINNALSGRNPAFNQFVILNQHNIRIHFGSSIGASHARCIKCNKTIEGYG